MLIKLEHAFVESEEKLNHPFSEIYKTKLSEAIESNSERIRSVIFSSRTSRGKMETNCH